MQTFIVGTVPLCERHRPPAALLAFIESLPLDTKCVKASLQRAEARVYCTFRCMLTLYVYRSLAFQRYTGTASANSCDGFTEVVAYPTTDADQTNA
jgi:hypothetical protein